MSNPYAAPVSSGGLSPPGPVGNKLGQVKAFAICLIVQGALECLLGLLIVASSFLSLGFSPSQNPAEVSEMLMWYMIVNGVGGGVAVTAGGLRITAGILNLTLKGRTLGIVSLVFGLLNLFACYCIPTSIGLCIWGCILYFDNGVAEAFRLRRQGLSVAEINHQLQRPN